MVKKLGHPDLTSSDGCLDCFKTRHHIVSCLVSGEGAAITTKITDEWLQTGLPHVLNEYEPSDVFNPDETDCFTVFCPIVL